MKKEKVKELKEILKGTCKDNSGYRLLFRVERVARSDMSRCISVYTQNKKGVHKNITKLVSDIIEGTYTKEGYLRVYGCGMDMLFDTYYTLNSVIKNIDNYKGKKKTDYNYLVSTYYDLV